MRLISKQLVVGAVASACAYVSAGTLTVTTADYMLESALARSSASSIGMNGAYNGVNPGASATLVIGSSTDSGGLLFTGNQLSKDTSRLAFTSNRSFGSANGHSASIACSATAATNATATFTLDTSNTNSSIVIYDLTSRGTDLTTDMSCQVPNLVFLPSSFAANGAISVGATVTNINSGFTLDTIASTKVASVGATFAVAITSTFDAVIDVQSNRLTFASGIDAGPNPTAESGQTGPYVDAFVATWTAGTTAKSTVGGTFDHTFNLTLTAGTDFGFLEDPAGATGGGSCTVGTGSGRATGSQGNTGVTPVVNASFGCNTLTLTGTAVAAGAADVVYKVGLGRAGTNYSASSASVFAPQSYTATYSITSLSRTLLAATSVSAGSWSLNGTNVTLQYVPVAADTNLQLFVSNGGAAGTASFTATNHAGASCSGTLGAVGAGSTSLGSALKRALLGTPGTGETSTCSTSFASEGRASVTLTTTTPATLTRVHSGFSKNDGVSRGLIINSSN